MQISLIPTIELKRNNFSVLLDIIPEAKSLSNNQTVTSDLLKKLISKYKIFLELYDDVDIDNDTLVTNKQLQFDFDLIFQCDMLMWCLVHINEIQLHDAYGSVGLGYTLDGDDIFGISADDLRHLSELGAYLRSQNRSPDTALHHVVIRRQ